LQLIEESTIMRTSFTFLALAALVAAVLFVPAAEATQIVPGSQYTLHFSNLDQSFGSGGLFQYDWTDPAVDDYSVYGYAPEATWNGGKGFYSFCLEKNELIHPNRSYYAELSLIQKSDSDDTAAVAGGTGAIDYGTFWGDPISNATAYLYYMFATGQFGDLNDNANNIPGLTDAQAVKALQDAIWAYEEEISAPASNWFMDQVDAYFGVGGAGEAYSALDNYDAGADGPLFPKLDGSGIPVGKYTVYAVNTTYMDTGARAQDTLFMTYYDYPTGVIPEPTALLIWALGLSLAGLGRRGRKN
jgi:hypothetical protein